MRKTLLAFALLALAAPAQADANWSSLWRTADQRGEVLLHGGDAHAAAETYADPRRKGYAEFMAGNYAAAAHDLAGFDDSEANYNRGNALAYAGDLNGALSAYDAALKIDPHNVDARHNRALVANALGQKRAQQKDSNKENPQDGLHGKKQDGQHSDQESGKQGGQGANVKNGSQAPVPPVPTVAEKRAQTGQTGDAANTGQRALGPSTPGSTSQQAKNLPGGHDFRAAQQTARKNQKVADGNDADQARRDAAASRTGAAQGKPGSDGIVARAAGHALQMVPQSEKQIAQEQWLRSIPDDPGGLLRRKFLIEHMMRQGSTIQP